MPGQVRALSIGGSSFHTFSRQLFTKYDWPKARARCRSFTAEDIVGDPKHKKTSVLPMQLPTPTNIPSLSKALETTPSTSVHGDGHNTEQSGTARRIPMHVPNFPILRELPLLLILSLKLPGNAAHGDHTQHVHSARPHTMASLPAHLGPAETPSSTLLIEENRQNVSCFSATFTATRPETLCFVSVSPLTRLKTFYLFYERECRYKTDVRFPENTHNVSLCVALYVALTLHYVALKRLSVFCTDVECTVLSRQTVARGTEECKAPGGHPSMGRRPFRGSIFGYGNTTWFWCRGVDSPW